MSGGMPSNCGRAESFEPPRLPLDEMEYTTMPQIMKKLEGCWVNR
jgi:fructose 1,6-bisphosphatase